MLPSFHIAVVHRFVAQNMSEGEYPLKYTVPKVTTGDEIRHDTTSGGLHLSLVANPLRSYVDPL